MQAGFVAEVIDRLDNLHVLLDTSGYGSEKDLRLLLDRVDMVYYDLKLIDEAAHIRCTGQSNRVILSNLQLLSGSGVPFTARIPLIPGVTDTDENLTGIAEALRGLPGLMRVDLLPYNRAAGAKYPAAGMDFHPDYDEAQPVHVNTRVFLEAGEKVHLA
jgi:pyruvate formate lyase activating enzyme